MSIFHCRTIHSRLNNLQDRALRLVRKVSDTTTVTTHKHSLQLLLTEVFKAKKDLGPSFMRNIFTERDSYYNLGSENHFLLPKANTTIYGIDSIYGPHCQMNLKILTNFLSSRGKINN